MFRIDTTRRSGSGLIPSQASFRWVKLIIEQIRLTVIYAVFGILVFLWPNEVAKCVDGRSESSVKVHKLIACVS